MSIAALDHLVPPDASWDDPLREALAIDAALRLRRALREWRRHSARAPDIAVFQGIAAGAGPFRCWLAEVEDALAIAEAARRGTSSARRRLIELVADAGILAKLAPRGRIPGDFTERASREINRRLAVSVRAIARLPRLDDAGAHDPEVGRPLVERGLAIVEARRDPAFERRVARALALLDAAWPEGASMIRGRTWRVVPVTAWATVSYSSSRQPGIVFIDVKSAPLLRLAEDLVHETIHVRVHELEALHPLVIAAARETSDAAEPRFYSPWRREWRPLRGLIHAVCTFTAGAMFFEKMLKASERPHRIRVGAARRRWLARRLLEERAAVAMSLRALAEAARRGLLTVAGRRLVDAARREHRALARAEGPRRARLATTAAGREELAAVARLVASWNEHAVRWRWSSEPGERRA